MEKLSLQSANLNGIKVLMTTTRNELKKLNIPNSRLLMYYGLTFEKNDYIDPFIVKYLHSKLKKEIKIQDYILNFLTLKYIQYHHY